MGDHMQNALPADYVDENFIRPRRCTFHKPAQAIEEKRLQDLSSYRFDEHNRLKEARSRAGFITVFQYENGSNELRSYVVLDPNRSMFERGRRHLDGRWAVERLNPAKGKLESLPNDFLHVTLNKDGNVARVDQSGANHVLNVRLGRSEMMNTLAEYAWVV